LQAKRERVIMPLINHARVKLVHFTDPATDKKPEPGVLLTKKCNRTQQKTSWFFECLQKIVAVNNNYDGIKSTETLFNVWSLKLWNQNFVQILGLKKNQHKFTGQLPTYTRLEILSERLNKISVAKRLKVRPQNTKRAE
jgi:hypothetical protein